MGKVWLQEKRWPEIKDYLDKGGDIVLIPVGSTEQHGPHLPLGTDAMVAIRLAEDAGRIASVVSSPPLWFGWSPHHLGFPGTISVRAETVIVVVEDICRSLLHHGFKKLLIINGHRQTNLSPLLIAAMNVKQETGAFIAVVDPIFLGAGKAIKLRKSVMGSYGHGGELETSHMLFLYPELTNQKVAKKRIPRYESEFMELDFYSGGDKVAWVFDPEDMGRLSGGEGSFGDPTASTEKAGEEYHQSLVSNLVRFINDIRGMKVTVKRERLSGQ